VGQSSDDRGCCIGAGWSGFLNFSRIFLSSTTMISSVPRACPAQRNNAGYTHIIQLSDLHFDRTAVFSEDKRSLILSALEAGLQQCRAQRGDPDVLVVTGDIIHGDVGDFFWVFHSRSGIEAVLADAKKYLLNLAEQILGLQPSIGQLLIIPGNHDFKYRGLRRQPVSKAAFLSAFEDFYRHTWFPHLNLFIACFDSNVSTRGKCRREQSPGEFLSICRADVARQLPTDLGVERY
jgi:predicted MPP superfamily phosphohydrolase